MAFLNRKNHEDVTNALLNGHPTRICKDCRHFEKEHSYCHYNNPIVVDLVYGYKTRKRDGGLPARHARDQRYCGEEGKWWEPKPPTTWKQMLLRAIILSPIVFFVMWIIILALK